MMLELSREEAWGGGGLSWKSGSRYADGHKHFLIDEVLKASTTCGGFLKPYLEIYRRVWQTKHNFPAALQSDPL